MSFPRWTAAGLLLVVLLAACDNRSAPATPGVIRTPMTSPAAADSRVIGLVGTLSGDDSWRGEDAFEGADLGVHVLNRSLDEGEPPFELVTLDDGGEAARATELVGELASSQQTVGVVYAGPPEGLPGAEAALARAGIPAMLAYGDLYSGRLLRPHLFQVSPPYLWQARRVVSYLLRDRRYRKIGLLTERSLTGATARGALQTVLGARRGRAVAAAYAEGGEGDRVTAALRKLRRRRAEAIVVQGDPQLVTGILEILAGSDASYRGTAAARIASARPGVRQRRIGRNWWHPQVVAFDLGLAAGTGAAPAGTVASASYARGAHYLPVPSFRRFRSAFARWWDAPPLGWELRAYEAVRMIGWAARKARDGEDVAAVLEGIERKRFGGLDVTFGPDDHTSVEQTSVGLWVVPRRGARVTERDRLPERLPWVPLARGFSIDGERTDIAARDWKHLFRHPPPPMAPAPRFARMRFGVTTGRGDPIH